VFSAYISEDIFEGFFLIVGIFVIGSLIGFVYGYGAIRGFTGLTPTSNGELLKRLAIMDIINCGLCVIRVLVC
jgi:hypothetical protein